MIGKSKLCVFVLMIYVTFIFTGMINLEDEEQLKWKWRVESSDEAEAAKTGWNA
jgi:hypothetical protein